MRLIYDDIDECGCDSFINNRCATPADFANGHGHTALSLASPALKPRTVSGGHSFIDVNMHCTAKRT